MVFCSNNNTVHVYILTRVVVCVNVSVFQVECPTGIILLVEKLAVLSTNNIFVSMIFKLEYLHAMYNCFKMPSVQKMS